MTSDGEMTARLALIALDIIGFAAVAFVAIINAARTFDDGIEISFVKTSGHDKADAISDWNETNEEDGPK
jgi:hypothetical protein